ncbi:MAG: exodeoxyribonuclease VII small subunit [Oceanospirillaceae bacterium]|nr:exodeoxyribonuclease VII small subunit [Oceanospirillaceae bacterium]
MTSRKKAPSFEQSLADLENLVTRMETGDLSLDDSLSAFEEGVKLTRQCQKMLEEAEQKVQILTEKNGDLTSVPFESE